MAASTRSSNVVAIHLHHEPGVQGGPAQAADHQGHLAELLPRRQDRPAGPERCRQVHRAADHGRRGQGFRRRGPPAARHQGRPAAGAGLDPEDRARAVEKAWAKLQAQKRSTRSPPMPRTAPTSTPGQSRSAGGDLASGDAHTEQQLDVAADALRLPPWDAKIGNLSGEKRRVALAACCRSRTCCCWTTDQPPDAESVECWSSSAVTRHRGGGDP